MLTWNIPSVLYTWPEAAGVGYTEEELISEERDYKSGSFPFRALGRARAAMETDGLVKILADPVTDEILDGGTTVVIGNVTTTTLVATTQNATTQHKTTQI